MAIDFTMNVLQSDGNYEELYPFNPRLVLNGIFNHGDSTARNYKITIKGLTSLNNDIGLISFIPTIVNLSGLQLTINGLQSYPILLADGSAIPTQTLGNSRPVILKFYNNNFYIVTDKKQVGLGNVDNTSDLSKPISNATQTALNGKFSAPKEMTSDLTYNLNNYKTPRNVLYKKIITKCSKYR